LFMYVCFASAVYVPELWPTAIKLRGSGFCNSIGRLFTVFTPFGVAWILSNYGSVAVFATIAGVLVGVAIIVAFLGIETRAKSIEEIGLFADEVSEATAAGGVRESASRA